MKLTKLHLNCYCQHRNLTVDFCESTNVIIGYNGVGKSNIIHAILFVFTAEVSNAGKRTDDILWGETKGSVTGWFNSEGKKYRISRLLHNSGATLHRLENKTETLLADTASAVAVELEKILGVNPSQIARAVIKQGELSAALYETQSKREMMFNKLFNTDTSLIRDYLQDEILTASTVAGSAAVVTELQSQLTGDIIPALAEANEALVTGTTTVEAIPINDHRKLAKDYEDYQKETTANAQKAAQLSKLKEDLKKLKVTEKELSKGIPKNYDSALDKLKVKLAKVTKDNNDSIAHRARMVEFERRCEETDKNNKEMATLDIDEDNKVGKLSTKKDELTKERTLLTQEVSTLTKHVDLISKGECPTCERAFDNAETHAEEEQKKLVKLKDKLAKVVIDLNKVTTEHMTKSTKVTKDKARYAALEALNDKLCESIGIVEGSTFTLEESENLAKLFTETTNEVKQLEQKIKEYTAVTTDITNTENLVAAITITPISAVNITEAKYKEACDNIKYHKEWEDYVTTIKGNITALERQQYDTEQRLLKAKELEKKSESLNHYRMLCEKARDTLHHSKLPATVNRKYLEVLNGLLSKYMQLFNVGFLAQISENFDFQVMFPHESELKTALRLSGGQKSVLAISFWFAISELFTGGLGFIILDEPSHHLDSNAISGVREVFLAVGKSMLASGAQLIVITHEEALKDSFNKCVEIV